MRRCIYLLVFVSWHCYGQYNEFPIHSNGLIYDDHTMNKLSVIVDSLNLKFRSCDLSHPYFSFPQGIAHVVEVPNKLTRKAIQDGISFSDFSVKFPHQVKQRDFWIVRTPYKNYDGKRFIEYGGLPSQDRGYSITVKDVKRNDKATGWIIDEEGELAFYIEQLQAREIPYDYARLVQYVDCMIDTTAEIYLPDAKRAVYPRVDETSNAYRFIKWAENFPDEPKYPDYEKLTEHEFDSAYKAYERRYAKWDSLRLNSLDQTMKTSPHWEGLLADAADEAATTGNSDANLEFYVSRYLSKELALKLMRGRRVVGNCSQDQSPRFHAMNICKLAAETTKWDIFLRSHLDIMNDRFERQSDGSYAWAGRKTYLKELEALDIPAVDLLIGASLRVSNVSENHYWSSITRTGRALADAFDKDALEERLVTMISDEKLDPFNRLLMAYLFSNYLYNLDDDIRKSSAQEKLNTAVETMPQFVREAWDKD
jgi:hypothetical protein